MEHKELPLSQAAENPPQSVGAQHADTGEGQAPRGALVFVLLMAVGYAIYWFTEWYNIVITRGGQ